MSTTLRELELLIPLLALPSTLPASRQLHRATALDIFHFITGLFLIIYTSHIPCHFQCVSHSTPTSFLFEFPSIFITNFEAQLYKILSPYRYIKTAIISNRSLMGGMMVVIPSYSRGSHGSIPHSNHHMTQYFNSFTTSLASIFSSVLST